MSRDNLKFIQRFHYLPILVLYYIMLVYFAFDLCIFAFNVFRFHAMSALLTQFVSFNHCLASRTEFS